jgi:hypothetical protein
VGGIKRTQKYHPDNVIFNPADDLLKPDIGWYHQFFFANTITGFRHAAKWLIDDN